MKDDKISQVLNDLVQINNDRIAGYEVALSDTDESYINLRELFTRMIAESKILNEELASKIHTLHNEVAIGTSGMGKLYRTWMDMKAILTAGNIKNILSACETIENATQRAYEEALQDEDLTEETTLTISDQKRKLLVFHDQIKHLLTLAETD